jgi:lysyl-tRNA synthetase, class II
LLTPPSAVLGHPHRTNRGELSLKATSLPILLSPCLHDFPDTRSSLDREFQDRHTELLSFPQASDILRARSAIIQHVRSFLLSRFYLEVQTPILASSAGGAVARPFTTIATEFQSRPLSLRIAPELWLKRLILGGLDRVFEIGPSFRNEGLDKTHNPEFTTCEFYSAFSTLPDLLQLTESLLTSLQSHILSLHSTTFSTFFPPRDTFPTPFHTLEFIPTLESALNTTLPDLASPTATNLLLTLFKEHKLPLPFQPTLPRLLDKLSSLYLEPLCVTPTFITHHPVPLSPLSKSFNCPKTGQLVSARAELFINGQELANMYEEENSPFEQREKFIQQLAYRDWEGAGRDGTERAEGEGEVGDKIDESYLHALEWGLPPTGGWGCGIDRLVMLMTGAKRIGDVLSFGNLRAVTRGNSGD